MADCKDCGRTPVEARGRCHRCWQNFRNRQIAYGKWNPGRHPIGPVVEHLDRLQAAGMGVVRVADVAQLNRHTVQQLRRRKWCDEDVARAILDVPLPDSHFDLAPGAIIPAIGTVRRLQALARVGFSQKELAELLGVKFQFVSYIQLGKQANVTVGFARKVADVFNALEATPPRPGQTLNRAMQRGWRLPLEWDEDEIDDPDFMPPVSRAVKRENRAKQYASLKSRGLNDSQIAKEFGIHPSSLSTWLQRQRKKAAQK